MLSGVLVDHVPEVAWQCDEGPGEDKALDLEKLEQVHHIVVDVFHPPTTIDNTDGVINRRYLGLGCTGEREGKRGRTLSS